MEELHEKLTSYQDLVRRLVAENSKLKDELYAKAKESHRGARQSWLLDSTEEGQRELVVRESGIEVRPYEAPRVYED